MIGSDVPFNEDYKHSSLDNSMHSNTPSQYSNAKVSVKGNNRDNFNPHESFHEVDKRSGSQLKVMAL